MAEISIIVPVYNSSKYLEKCFESIRVQTFTNFEVIAINDGSTDDSGNICDKYASMDNRFKVIHKKNEGVSIARNTGIEQSCGKYITFIDSDDWVDEDYLQSMITAIASSCELIVSGVISEFSNGSTSILSIQSNYFASTNASQLHNLIRSRLYFGPCNKLFDSKIIKNQNILFPIGISYGEDRIFNFQYLKYVDNILTLSYNGYHYNRLDSGSLSTITRTNMFELEYSQWQLLNNAYKDKEAFNQEVQQDQYIDLFWIVHDNIFAQRTIGKSKFYSYIKKVLSIPEIADIRPYAESILYNKVIKYSILNRRSMVLYLYIQILNLCKK